ncbi:MAG: CotH kinase family protein [Oscillospiraceae bacterium]|nr:CotH kinase family protein [Oscillospiraceae bacterium]
MSVETRKIIIIAAVVFILLSSVVLLNAYPAEQAGIPELLAAAAENADTADGAVSGDAEGEEEAAGKINLQLAFSHTEHFYTSDISVTLIPSVEGAEIFYTLDGSDPITKPEREAALNAANTAADKQAADEDSRAELPPGELLKVKSFSFETFAYDGPIEIKAPSREINTVTIKAVVVYGDTESRPFIHTYFVGSRVNERFDTLVFSLTIEETHLYDYDTGIFVEGRTRFEYRRDNPRETINPPSPANFNWRGMEGERPVFVEVFEPDGKRVIAQAAGMRTHGGWSRAAQQKSIRLIARNEYENGYGKFHFDFFPGDMVNDGFQTPLGKYDQLILRNGANDRDFGMLRNEVSYELARLASLEVTTPVRPVAVFLNGEYYGFAWAQVRVNPQYLQDKFNAPTRNFQIVGMGELWIDTDDEEERSAIEFLHSFYTKDFTRDAIFNEFQDLIDLDNLLLYYSLQTYLGNHDWPNNNLKLWRYTGPWEEGMAYELDGRWRYIVFDMDWILGLYEDPPDAFRPTFQEMMNPRNDRYSNILNALFVRPEIADRFGMLMCDIAANIVTKENVGSLIDELFGASQNEISRALAAKKYAGWVSIGSVTHNHNNMLEVASKRSEYIFQSLREHFGWQDSMFTVEVTGSSPEAIAYIGTQKGESSKYFDHLVIPLRPALPENTVFDHWVLNGDILETPEITVSIADAVDGVVSVELVVREEIPLLIFKEAFGSSERNGCTLYNPGTVAVGTDGLYMTNNMTNPFLWALPGASIEPGSTLEFAGRGSRDSGDLHKIRMGFNARQGQRLFLCDDSGNVIAHILIEGISE